MLDLRSLDLLGGARQTEWLLANSIKTSFIYITGGIGDSAIHFPAGVVIRVQANGRIEKLLFDGQHFDVLGGMISLENARFQCASSRFDICITGGVSKVTI